MTADCAAIQQMAIDFDAFVRSRPAIVVTDRDIRSQREAVIRFRIGARSYEIAMRPNPVFCK
jgi:hypothetical protein